MLKVRKSINITGNSVIQTKQDGVTVERQIAYFSATISTEDGSINTNMGVQETALYEANKAQCRADEDEFKALVRAEEDALRQEVQQ